MPDDRICTKCNAVLEAGSAFCDQCGTGIDAAPGVRTAIFCSGCGAKAGAGAVFCSACGKTLVKEEQPVPPPITAPMTEEPQPVPPPIAAPMTEQTPPSSQALEEPAPESRTLLRPGVIAAAVLVLAGLAAVLLIVFRQGGESGEYFLYAKDQEIHIATLSDATPLQLSERLTDNYSLSADDFNWFKDFVVVDGNDRYVYYPDRAESYFNGYTYYWRDLRAGNGKNQTATKVDSEIYTAPAVSKDGNKLFYRKGDDNRLYVYDRKSDEKNKLDDGVSSFYVNETGDYLIYVIYDGWEGTIYEMEINGISGEREKISTCSRVYQVFPDEQKVFYAKDDVLYLKEFGKDAVKISSDVLNVVSIVDDGSVYYLKQTSGNRQDLYYWENQWDFLIEEDATNIFAKSTEIPVVVYVRSGFAVEVTYAKHSSSIHCTYPTQWAIAQDANSTSVEKATVFFLDEYSSGRGALKGVSARNETTTNFIGYSDKVVDEDVNSFFVSDGAAFYYKDVRNDIGDLYEDGTRIARDVYLPSMNSETGKLFYLTDYNSNSRTGTLCLIEKGSVIEIADDVADFLPVGGKKVAYLTDYSYSSRTGDLCLYNGESSALVDTDVSSIIIDVTSGEVYE